MAGEGIPAYFWEQSRKDNQEIIDVGTQNAASDNDNFSYQNAYLALVNKEIAGMLLAYRLSEPENTENLKDLPEFIRPLIELEQCVPGSFYINMLATYPKYRGKGVGTQLMGIADKLAAEADCTMISVEVFEQNRGALRLYQRLGYQIAEQRNIITHPCHPYAGRIFLLTKDIHAAADVV